MTGSAFAQQKDAAKGDWIARKFKTTDIDRPIKEKSNNSQRDTASCW